MDAQLKRGLLEVCVLKTLTKNDSYGYQIIKDLADIITISESTLYPILKRLENNNCVEVYTVEHNSRLRKYFKITDKGYERINDFIIEWENVMDIFKFIKGDNNE